jgi:hypothetical protein
MAQSMNRRFSPVWVSSTQHLEIHTSIWKKSTKMQQALGAYDIPADFPQVRLWWGAVPFFRGPLVFFSSGTLELDGDLSFVAQPRPRLLRILGNVERGLLLPWSFTVSRSTVEYVRAYRTPEPYLPIFTLPWVQIRFSTSARGTEELLLAIGGTVPTMGRLRRQNAILRSALEKWQQGQ